jgi:hypothetical protein
MKSATLVRRASLALVALTLACGDSTGPARLSEEQVVDMLEAMSSVAYTGDIPGGASFSRASLWAAPQTANATVSVSQTVSCPNGGTASVNGTATDNPDAGTASAHIVQSFAGCAATSSENRVWTFNGDITTDLSSSHNETTGAFSMTVTQVGGIGFASNLGNGNCPINLTLTMSGNETSFSLTMNGTACGHTIQQSFDYTE